MVCCTADALGLVATKKGRDGIEWSDASSPSRQVESGVKMRGSKLTPRKPCGNKTGQREREGSTSYDVNSKHEVTDAYNSPQDR